MAKRMTVPSVQTKTPAVSGGILAGVSRLISGLRKPGNITEKQVIGNGRLLLRQVSMLQDSEILGPGRPVLGNISSEGEEMFLRPFADGIYSIWSDNLRPQEKPAVKAAEVKEMAIAPAPVIEETFEIEIELTPEPTIPEESAPKPVSSISAERKILSTAKAAEVSPSPKKIARKMERAEKINEAKAAYRAAADKAREDLRANRAVKNEPEKKEVVTMIVTEKPTSQGTGWLDSLFAGDTFSRGDGFKAVADAHKAVRATIESLIPREWGLITFAAEKAVKENVILFGGIMTLRRRLAQEINRGLPVTVETEKLVTSVLVKYFSNRGFISKTERDARNKAEATKRQNAADLAKANEQVDRIVGRLRILRDSLIKESKGEASSPKGQEWKARWDFVKSEHPTNGVHPAIRKAHKALYEEVVRLMQKAATFHFKAVKAAEKPIINRDPEGSQIGNILQAQKAQEDIRKAWKTEVSSKLDKKGRKKIFLVIGEGPTTKRIAAPEVSEKSLPPYLQSEYGKIQAALVAARS